MKKWKRLVKYSKNIQGKASYRFAFHLSTNTTFQTGLWHKNLMSLSVSNFWSFPKYNISMWKILVLQCIIWNTIVKPQIPVKLPRKKKQKKGWTKGYARNCIKVQKGIRLHDGRKLSKITEFYLPERTKNYEHANVTEFFFFFKINHGILPD